MQKSLNKFQSRQCCSVYNSDNNKIFFSLVDYRNNYFTSDDPTKIIEFYDGFDNRNQLIKWMQERPKGIANIHEVDGDKDIIVVIPTADFNGKYAKECRDNIFKGLHMIFVQSAKAPDLYFNYAHNCNVGIRKAMEYGPKWVIVSNDDMYKMDNIGKLINTLDKLDNRTVSAVFAHPSSYHSKSEILGEVNLFAHIYYLRNKYSRTLSNLKKRFEIKIATASNKALLKIFFRRYITLRDFIDFGCYSATLVDEYDSKIYDETFINHFEDTELSLRLMLHRKNMFVSDFKIGSIEAGTLGGSFIRDLRGIASLTYFSSMYQSKFDGFYSSSNNTSS